MKVKTSNRRRTGRGLDPKKVEEPYRCWRGHAWIGAGMHKHEFICEGYQELNKTVRDMFEKEGAVEIHFWLGR